MPPDERTTKSAERCDLHPGTLSVARCGSCGRPLCLACAIPVRGKVLGSECLADAIGPDASPADSSQRADGRPRGSMLVGAAFAVATLSTMLPWSRFGVGSSPFGAWGRSLRWSMLASVAAASGLVLWAVLGALPPHLRRRCYAIIAVLSALVACGALLAILRPPSFTHVSLAPWLALVAGLTGLVASLATRSPRRGSEPPGTGIGTPGS